MSYYQEIFKAKLEWYSAVNSQLIYNGIILLEVDDMARLKYNGTFLEKSVPFEMPNKIIVEKSHTSCMDTFLKSNTEMWHIVYRGNLIKLYYKATPLEICNYIVCECDSLLEDMFKKYDKDKEIVDDLIRYVIRYSEHDKLEKNVNVILKLYPHKIDLINGLLKLRKCIKIFNSVLSDEELMNITEQEFLFTVNHCNSFRSMIPLLKHCNNLVNKHSDMFSVRLDYIVLKEKYRCHIHYTDLIEYMPILADYPFFKDKFLNLINVVYDDDTKKIIYKELVKIFPDVILTKGVLYGK